MFCYTINMENEEKLLTTKEAAERLNISVAAVYQAMNEGRLPYVIVLGKRGISESALASYLPRAYGERPGRKVGGRPKKEQQTNA